MRGSEPGDLVDDIRTVAARLRVSSPGSADDLRAGRLEAHADELEAAAAAPVAAGGEPEDALIEAERQRQIAWNLAHAFAAAAPVGGGVEAEPPSGGWSWDNGGWGPGPCPPTPAAAPLDEPPADPDEQECADHAYNRRVMNDAAAVGRTDAARRAGSGTP